MQKTIKCRLCREKPVITIHENRRTLCRKHFIEYFERKVRKTVRVYDFFKKGENVLVACSGGKDSTTALHLINKLAKERRADVSALAIDVSIPNYSKRNLENLRKFCRKEKIKLHETSFKEEFGYPISKIISLLKSKGIDYNACTLCGILRRYLLNKKAKELKADKLVTGHNLDDEAQSVLMNLFKSNMKVLSRLGPKSYSLKGFVPRIKPLYFMTEQEIEKYSRLMKFPVLYRSCPYSSDAFRRSVMKMLDDFDRRYAGTKHSIVSSFLELLPLLRRGKKGRLGFCRMCGEPAANEVCKSCELVGKIKNQ